VPWWIAAQLPVADCCWSKNQEKITGYCAKGQINFNKRFPMQAWFKSIYEYVSGFNYFWLGWNLERNERGWGLVKI
jgi:hypothetical protein